MGKSRQHENDGLYTDAQIEVAVLDAMRAGKCQANTITAHSGLDAEAVRAALKALAGDGVVNAYRHRRAGTTRYYVKAAHC